MLVSLELAGVCCFAQGHFGRADVSLQMKYFMTHTHLCVIIICYFRVHKSHFFPKVS